MWCGSSWTNLTRELGRIVILSTSKKKWLPNKSGKFSKLLLVVHYVLLILLTPSTWRSDVQYKNGEWVVGVGSWMVGSEKEMHACKHFTKPRQVEQFFGE